MVFGDCSTVVNPSAQSFTVGIGQAPFQLWQPRKDSSLTPAMGNLMAGATAKTQIPLELQGEPCDICGAPTLEIHCKVICKNCGYIRDCSDP